MFRKMKVLMNLGATLLHATWHKTACIRKFARLQWILPPSSSSSLLFILINLPLFLEIFIRFAYVICVILKFLMILTGFVRVRLNQFFWKKLKNVRLSQFFCLKIWECQFLSVQMLEKNFWYKKFENFF